MRTIICLLLACACGTDDENTSDDTDIEETPPPVTATVQLLDVQGTLAFWWSHTLGNPEILHVIKITGILASNSWIPVNVLAVDKLGANVITFLQDHP